MNAISPASYETDDARWTALRTRDKRADGHFFYAVATTGVYCRPSCGARPARVENVSFHRDRASVERAGYRPCKRCKPDLPPQSEREAALVAEACRRIEAAEETPALEALAAAAGVSRFHFHRLFRRVTGVTPKAYASSERAKRVQAQLQRGASVTSALYDAGFNSSGRFYEAADAILGMRPGAFRAKGAGETITYATGASSLGTVLVAATTRGVCAILLADDPAAALADLQARFSRAQLVPASPELASWLHQVIALVEAPHAGLSLPLDIRGTAFQRRVWEALRAIPPGVTVSYGELAAGFGSPQSVRAVAGACGANPLAVAVPCHRVVGRDGGLTGYRWGMERKRALLERERKPG